MQVKNLRQGPKLLHVTLCKCQANPLLRVHCMFKQVHRESQQTITIEDQCKVLIADFQTTQMYRVVKSQCPSSIHIYDMFLQELQDTHKQHGQVTKRSATTALSNRLSENTKCLNDTNFNVQYNIMIPDCERFAILSTDPGR